MFMRFQLLSFAFLAACSTKANPNACCVSADDCAQAGLSSTKSCDQGLACVDNQCIQETCSTSGCMADKPVCNVVTNVCDGCTMATDCANYPGQAVCDTSSGACVACVAAADCPTATPVCDMNVCRACATDVDCASGACADDGSCVADTAIVYLDPAGSDSGACPSEAPCRSIRYGVGKTSEVRPHIVMRAGAYVESVGLSAQSTTAPKLYLHGAGATLTNPVSHDGGLFTDDGPVRIIGLTMVNEGGNGVDLTTGELRDVTIRSYGVGLSASGGTVLLANTLLQGTSGGANAIQLYGSANISLDRVQVRGPWQKGIVVENFGATLDVRNSLIYGTSDLAMDLSMASGGTVSFTTIANSGTDSGTGPRAVACPSTVTFRSSIIWAPGTTVRAPIQGCNVATSIAGPAPVSGVSNADPMFVNSAGGDFHLVAGSPAIDMVDTGPDHDFEGDPRPAGPRFDIGADEAH